MKKYAKFLPFFSLLLVLIAIQLFYSYPRPVTYELVESASDAVGDTNEGGLIQNELSKDGMSKEGPGTATRTNLIVTNNNRRKIYVFVNDKRVVIGRMSRVVVENVGRVVGHCNELIKAR